MNAIKKICMLVGAGVLSLFVLGLLLVVIGVALGGLGGGSSNLGPILTNRAVGVVDLSGEILSSDGFRKDFEKLIKNEKIRSIVVRIESPGGAVGASEEIYRIIKNSSKPTVCSLGNVAASGGLYAAVGCKKIVANAGTLTGSIGVILMMPNVRSIADKFGLEMNVIKSGRYKDAGSPFRALSVEDKELFQHLVDQSYEQFVGVIGESRGLKREDVARFADGRVILGEQGVEYGLVDALGGLDHAAKLSLTLLEPAVEGEPEIILPRKPGGLMGFFEEFAESKLLLQLSEWGQVRLLYQAFL